MAKLGKKQWAEVRQQWESDEREGHQWLADELASQGHDVSRVTIAKAAKRQGWIKKVTGSDKKSLKKVTHSDKKSPERKVVADVPGQGLATLEPPVRGRPTDYRTEYDELAYKFCLLGATDEGLAELLEVSESTINVWKHKHPTFLESIRGGKAIADSRVAQSTYLSALGGHYIEEEKAVSDGQGGQDIITIKKQVPPDFRAQQFWLKNRQKELWRDRIEVQEEITVAKIPWDELREITRQSVEKAKRKHEDFIEGRYKRLGIEKEYQSD